MKAVTTFIVSSILFISVSVNAESTKKVLIIASNLVDMGDPEKHEARNDLFEFAPPYHVFKSHGYEIDFVSPQGGEIHFLLNSLFLI